MLAAGIAATGSVARAAEPARIVRPDWAQRPSGEDLARYYPERAQRLEAEGRVVMQCRVQASGDLTACEVVSETPPGMGFGEATLKLAPLFRMKPATRDGVPVDGALIRMPIVYKLPGNPPPAPSPKAGPVEADAAARAAAGAVRSLRRPGVTGEELEALRQRTPKLHLGGMTGPWAWLTLGALALAGALAGLGLIVRRERGRPTDV